MTTALPTTIDDLTADWLSAALEYATPGIVVDEVTVDSVIWGTATKVFLSVAYGKCPEDGPGSKLCVKGGFQEDLRQIAGIGYRLEAAFYRDIAPHLDVPLPRSWFAAVDEQSNQGLVVLDDLRSDSATFGRAGLAYTVDEVAAGLELQATWHARTWDRSGPGAPSWLTIGSPFYRGAMDNMYLVPQHWDHFLDLPQTRALDESLRDRARVTRGLHRQWEIDDAATLCLSHGDAHIGNTYRVPGDPAPRFLDWQVFSLGPWSVDVAYFMVGSLDVTMRRQNEEDLLRHYLEVLGGHGVPAPSFDAAMLAVRRHHLHGLMWAFCPPEMQDPLDCAEMAYRHATAATDHDTLAVLGV